MTRPSWRSFDTVASMAGSVAPMASVIGSNASRGRKKTKARPAPSPVTGPAQRCQPAHAAGIHAADPATPRPITSSRRNKPRMGQAAMRPGFQAAAPPASPHMTAQTTAITDDISCPNPSANNLDHTTCAPTLPAPESANAAESRKRMDRASLGNPAFGAGFRRHQLTFSRNFRLCGTCCSAVGDSSSMK
ncbi:MAG: hypothetical protein HYR88_07190 [Verrucomicrobia bacterium]|nr:hypothetical protein [Verrucomicrobiota bacterium]